MRFLRGCAVVLLALVALATAAYVVHGLVETAAVARAKGQAADDLEAGVPDGRARVDEARGTVLAAVADRRGPPTYSWQELHCDLGSVDAGWIVQSYTQQCQVRSVDLVPVPAVDADRCDFEPPPVDPPSSDGSVEPPLSVALHRGPTSGFDRAHPYEAWCPDGILAPPELGATRLLSGSRPANLDTSPAWLAVTVDAQVSDSDLGCNPWGLVFCGEPVDEPVLGDLD